MTWSAAADKHGVAHEDAPHAMMHALYVETSFDDPRPLATIRPTLYIGPQRDRRAPLLQTAVRGRKTLGADRPAGRSPKRQATLPEELDRRGLAFIQAGGAHDYSALMRAALTEYLDQHASA